MMYQISYYDEREKNTALRADLTAALAQLAEKEAKLCRIAVVVNDAQLREEDEAISDIDDEIATSTPCPHAKEAERMKGAGRWICSAILGEWANGFNDAGSIVDEYRRRAGGVL
jgi:hypothetical protein